MVGDEKGMERNGEGQTFHPMMLPDQAGKRARHAPRCPGDGQALPGLVPALSLRHSRAVPRLARNAVPETLCPERCARNADRALWYNIAYPRARRRGACGQTSSASPCLSGNVTGTMKLSCDYRHLACPCVSRPPLRAVHLANRCWRISLAVQPGSRPAFCIDQAKKLPA